MSNDYKIQNEEFWYEPLDDFQSYGEIVVVEISEVDFLNENAAGLKEKGVVDFGDWKEGYKDSWPVQRVYPLE